MSKTIKLGHIKCKFGHDMKFSHIEGNNNYYSCDECTFFYREFDNLKERLKRLKNFIFLKSKSLQDKLFYFARKIKFYISLRKHFLNKKFIFFRHSWNVGQKEITCRYKIAKNKYGYIQERFDIDYKRDRFYLCRNLGIHGECSSYIKKVTYLKNKVFFIINDELINKSIFYARICGKKGIYKIGNTTHYIY